MYPFKEKMINSRLLLREFSKDVNSDELAWHRDRENRIVTVVEGKDWLLQIDNNVPSLMESGKSYSIPKKHIP